MPLGFKLIAFGIILLLPKTYLYLSDAPPLEAQSASERQISTLVVHWMLAQPAISPSLRLKSSNVERVLSTTAATPWLFTR
jgi:hypothetical protein